MTTREKIAVLLAHEDGAIIELKELTSEGWYPVTNPKFNFAKFDYRRAEDQDSARLHANTIPFYVDYSYASQIEQDKKVHGPLIKIDLANGSYYYEDFWMRGEVIKFGSGANKPYYNHFPIKRLKGHDFKWYDGTDFKHKIEE